MKLDRTHTSRLLLEKAPRSFRHLDLVCLLLVELNQAPIVEAAETAAIRANDFLSSIGVCSVVSRRGENLASTIEAAKHLGLRWIRTGYESGIPVADLLESHQHTGVRFSYGLMSGGTNVTRLLNGTRQLASAGALIAIGNWGLIYEGQRGGRTNTWLSNHRMTIETP